MVDDRKKEQLPILLPEDLHEALERARHSLGVSEGLRQRGVEDAVYTWGVGWDNIAYAHEHFGASLEAIATELSMAEDFIAEGLAGREEDLRAAGISFRYGQRIDPPTE